MPQARYRSRSGFDRCSLSEAIARRAGQVGRASTGADSRGSFHEPEEGNVRASARPRWSTSIAWPATMPGFHAGHAPATRASATRPIRPRSKRSSPWGGNNSTPGSACDARYRSARCSASSTAGRADATGHPPRHELSCGVPPRRQQCGAASHHTSSATRRGHCDEGLRCEPCESLVFASRACKPSVGALPPRTPLSPPGFTTPTRR
jgi:hypothetical protein